MYMIEISEDKYSKMAKAVKCLLEKAELVKDLLDDSESLDFRKHEDYDYYDRPRRGRYL